MIEQLNKNSPVNIVINNYEVSNSYAQCIEHEPRFNDTATLCVTKQEKMCVEECFLLDPIGDMPVLVHCCGSEILLDVLHGVTATMVALSVQEKKMISHTPFYSMIKE